MCLKILPSSDSILKPALLILLTVWRLMLHPTSETLMGFSRSMMLPQNLFSLLTCSQNINLPSCLHTLFNSSNPKIGLGTVQNTQVATTVSKVSSANCRLSMSISYSSMFRFKAFAFSLAFCSIF